MAGIVAVWIVLFAFLVGLPSSGGGNGDGEIPVDVIGTDSESRDVQKSPIAFQTDFQNLSALKKVQLGDVLDKIQNGTLEQTTVLGSLIKCGGRWPSRWRRSTLPATPSSPSPTCCPGTQFCRSEIDFILGI